MHAQQIPGGAPPPTLPIPMHPSLAPGQLAGLPNNNGPTPGTPQQLAMLTKQELMLHSRPEEGNGSGGSGNKSGPNDENRHVSFFF